MGTRTFFWVTIFFILFWTLVFGSGLGLLNYTQAHLSAEPALASYVLPVSPSTPAVFLQLLPGFKTFRSKKLGIEFNYQEILKVSEKDGVVTIEHSTPFEHLDPCDGSRRNPKSKKILDFYAQISILPLTPTELFLQQVMQFDENGSVIAPKNTLRVTYGELDGFRVYNGEHGCGPYSYFFQLSPEKVLQMDRWPAPEFKEMPESDKQIYNRLRQIILPEQEEHIFREILISLTLSK